MAYSSDGRVSESNTANVLTVDNVNGDSFTIPAWADFVRLSISGADVYYRAGASTLTPASLDLAGVPRDELLPNGSSWTLSCRAAAKICFITAAGTATVSINGAVQ